MGSNDYHAVSLSGGKDSTAMLLMMLERGMPIDVVLCADPGMEFPEMYAHLDKLDKYLCRERGLHIECLRNPGSFEYYMFDAPVDRGEEWKNIAPCGSGWPSMRIRWCTSALKTSLINNRINQLKSGRNVIHYVGIAADEAHRCKKDKRYPLVEWGIDEATALQYCYDRGFDWGGLYEIYHRVSCWCCPLQRIGELRKLRRHHPELWQRLRDMDLRARDQFGKGPLGQFKADWSVELLEERFSNEDSQINIWEGS